MTDDLVDSLLRCGLYFGAVFQIICIAAAVVIPDKMNDFTASYKEMDCGGGGGGGGGGAGGGGGGSGGGGGGSEDEASDRSTPHATPRRPAHAHAHVHHRPRKQEKKKRR